MPPLHPDSPLLPDPTMSAEDQAATKLAIKALMQARKRRRWLASYTVGRIWARYGPEGISTALMAWCDAYGRHVTGKPRNFGIQLRSVDPATGRCGRHDDPRLPVEVRWAACALQARLAMDQEAWKVCMRAANTTSRMATTHTLALMHMVAATMRGLPSGYAVVAEVDDECSGPLT